MLNRGAKLFQAQGLYGRGSLGNWPENQLMFMADCFGETEVTRHRTSAPNPLGFTVRSREESKDKLYFSFFRPNNDQTTGVHLTRDSNCKRRRKGVKEEG